ncbi:Rad4 beta-hairpin domain 1 [Penicillium longicatenatum]|uniref:Rad4 beta-hairpin domain 1 n=1 Tax=Penicillium longicatenatum TaxID=1561947 RepID=UPI002546FDD9|nr:Rad4 beta-hairpin domain 1 [Penicillium longicatenatum]KAJ5651291.1 Rad4 beta-hairpin domain 1 [Penicillium longicatenatum]
MPPFPPRKRISSEDPPPAKRQAQAHNDIPAKPVPDPDSSSDSDSELSDVPEELEESINTPGAGPAEASDDEDSDDEIDWEDAIDTKTTNTTPTLAVPELQDLELTLDKNENEIVDLVDPKKGPTKIERQIRIQSHCMHVQCLLFHNAIRNAWINDAKVHEILRKKLPEGIHKEVKKWRIASGLELPEKKPEPPKSKKKGKKARKSQDWGEDSERLEPGQPDMSRGDPVIILLKVLVAYWRKQFRITAPGLRKHGYRPVAALDVILKDFHKEDHDPERHGERIANLEEFRATAESMQGSRDVGAQLFTALIRALGIEARLVGSLQPLGFGWTKAEIYTPPKSKTEQEQENAKGKEKEPAEAAKHKSESDADSEPKKPKQKKGGSAYDNDLLFPIYWTEVASPVTHEITSVDPIVLSNPIAPTADLQAAFEPRGTKAEKAKQVICYVVAHSADGTAKDVTTRYLKRRTWPGKTKGFRMPVDKIPIPGRRGEYLEFDWFRVVMRGYERPPQNRTEVDRLEDEKDLQRKQPEKKKLVQTGDTLQSLRTSAEFVLERFLRREEALKPGAESVRTFTSGKGARTKEEPVFLRADVVKCMSAESWHKEGRQVQPGAVPLKRVPIRAVTLMRKREVEELQRETGEKPMQGLYARDQTEYIIPPPIVDGIIPKNDYGNIDCFVPTMVPRGATHVPLPATVRLCKKLGIDYAEAVTGFEFGSKMAVPVIQGVVVASENADLLRDAWRIDAAEKRKREELKAEKRILQTWRKFLFGLRIAERVREEYGGGDPDDDRERETHNPFVARKKNTVDDVDERHFHDESIQDRAEGYDPVEHGGGFLLPGEGDDGDDGLIVEHHKEEQNQLADKSSHPVSEDGSSEGLSPPISIPSSSDEEGGDSEPEYAPSRNTRRRRRGG